MNFMDVWNLHVPVRSEILSQELKDIEQKSHVHPMIAGDLRCFGGRLVGYVQPLEEEGLLGCTICIYHIHIYIYICCVYIYINYTTQI